MMKYNLEINKVVVDSSSSKNDQRLGGITMSFTTLAAMEAVYMAILNIAVPEFEHGATMIHDKPK